MGDERGMRCVADVNKEGWENAEFPILCETCMGDNPYMRMQKEVYGSQCKICNRPFTVFRYRPGAKARYKSTMVCQSCAKMKNVCQTCLFDLEYGLPVEVRDKYLDEHERLNLPDSKVGKQVQLDAITKRLENGDTPYGKATGDAHEFLSKIARKTPYYKRNETRLCSFFAKGECNRGGECPFKHELPDDGPLSKQNLRDRFHGVNDPVAAKIFRVAKERFTLDKPEDKTLTTLYVGGLDPSIADTDIRDAMYHFGEISQIRMIAKVHCAFVTFKTRESAEKCADKHYKNFNVKGFRLRLSWAKPSKEQLAEKAKQDAQDGTLGGAPCPVGPTGPIGPLGQVKPYYPSSDPAAFGNAPLEGPLGGGHSLASGPGMPVVPGLPAGGPGPSQGPVAPPFPSPSYFAPPGPAPVAPQPQA